MGTAAGPPGWVRRDSPRNITHPDDETQIGAQCAFETPPSLAASSTTPGARAMTRRLVDGAMHSVATAGLRLGRQGGGNASGSFGLRISGPIGIDGHAIRVSQTLQLSSGCARSSGRRPGRQRAKATLKGDPVAPSVAMQGPRYDPTTKRRDRTRALPRRRRSTT